MTFATERFRRLAEVAAASKGVPNLRLVILPWDIEYHNDPAWFEALATQTLPSVVEALTKPLDQ